MHIKAVRRLKHWFRTRKVRGYEAIDGWLTPAEASALYRLARGLRPGATIVEIGSWKGKSTLCLARGLRSGRVIAIDPFDGAGEDGENTYIDKMHAGPLIDQFRRNLADAGLLERIDVRVGLSQAFTDATGPIDLLFIDGDHSVEGCRFDFEAFSPHVVPGGLLAFHDYSARRPDLGPTWVVDNLVSRAPGWARLGKWDSLVAFKRTA